MRGLARGKSICITVSRLRQGVTKLRKKLRIKFSDDTQT